MSSVSVRLVERGDGVSVPDRRAEVSPGAEAAAYATDPERRRSPVAADIAPPSVTEAIRHRLGAVGGVGDRPRILSMA
jgi:hypothetical protein